MRVTWTRAALRQLDEIQDYVAQDRPSAAFKLVADLIERANRLLCAMPLIGRPGRIPGTREWVASGTPYILVYQVREQDEYQVREQDEILAVVHAARDWSGEIPEA
jgi:toxin ParE1/3/4